MQTQPVCDLLSNVQVAQYPQCLPVSLSLLISKGVLSISTGFLSVAAVPLCGYFYELPKLDTSAASRKQEMGSRSQL